MLNDPIYILAVLSLNVFLSEWLVRHSFCRHFGTALLVIVLTAIVANLGLIPASTVGSPVYDGVFEYVAPLAIFWLLLQVSIRDILKAGTPMLVMFLIGAMGTLVGVLVGMWAINGSESIGEQYRAIGGMFTGTYIGGSVNFSALALHYGVARDGVLYGATTAVDNIMTAVWMVVTIAVPRALRGVWPRPSRAPIEKPTDKASNRGDDDTETVRPLDLALILAVGATALWLSDHLAAYLAKRELPVPSILILTTVALILGQIPAVARLRGSRLMGMFAVYLFLATIGAFCDFAALGEIRELGTTLLIFVTVVVAIHGVITFGMGALLRLDPDVVAVASQANIGGGTSALALARSLQRSDLVLPAILVGSLGYGVGTYLGFLTAGYLL
ncbi:MAG: DUF819 family protein [Planctomycetes bacterium]|nr:DUF819 family protein [Planctomycetota bacterium]